MVSAFKHLLSHMPMLPHRIFSDKGTEFKNSQLKALFKEEEIAKHESVHSSVKASVAERMIRTIKQRLYRFFSQKQTLNWTGVVEQIVDGINHSRSRTHGMRPVDVNFKNAQTIWERLYGGEIRRSLFSKKASKKTRFKPGQTVRMSRDKHQFEKGYLPNYGDEILVVDKVKSHMRPVRIKLRDEKGEPFRSFFYPEELAPVRRDAETTFRIEKVFRKRTLTDGTKEILVKFIGFPDREWIHETQLV